MGRPSLAKVRTAEILDAFERCVARFGVEGSSLERIAEEAGMKRSILRHYVGNREDLLLALSERVLGKYRGYMQEFVDSVTDQDRQRQLLDFFFPQQPTQTTESILVVEALIAAGDQYPQIRQAMAEYVEELVDLVADQLEMIHPKAKRAAAWQAAYGVVALCFNQDSLTPLQLPDKYAKATKLNAEKLINALA